MYLLQIKDPDGYQPGWHFADSVWETEVGVTYFINSDPRKIPVLEDAKSLAIELSEIWGVTAGVFDEGVEALVFKAGA